MTTPAAPINADAARALMDKYLDSAYLQTAAPVLDYLANGTVSGELAQRLRDLDAEVKRLKTESKPLIETNPVLVALKAAINTYLERARSLVDAVAPAVQQSGVAAAPIVNQQLALPGMTTQAIASLGIDWTTPDGQALADLIDYTQGAAWSGELADYVTMTGDQIWNAILDSMQGDSLTLSSSAASIIESLATYAAAFILRAVQMQAYRDASAAVIAANADIVIEVIRVAVLDRSTCLSCVALHGSRLPIGDKVYDHPNGRCMAVPVIVGRNVVEQTGNQWFASQTEALQRELMGHAAFEAYKAGKVTLNDFPQAYNDRLLGDAIREASLKSLLGESAKKYYKSMTDARN